MEPGIQRRKGGKVNLLGKTKKAQLMKNNIIPSEKKRRSPRVIITWGWIHKESQGLCILQHEKKEQAKDLKEFLLWYKTKTSTTSSRTAGQSTKERRGRKVDAKKKRVTGAVKKISTEKTLRGRGTGLERYWLPRMRLKTKSRKKKKNQETIKKKRPLLKRRRGGKTWLNGTRKMSNTWWRTCLQAINKNSGEVPKWHARKCRRSTEGGGRKRHI